MKKNLFFLLCWMVACLSTSAQQVQIDLNLSSSNNSVVGQSLYHVSESIYTNSEIGENNFTVNSINQIAFSFSQIGNPAQVNSFKVWMKNIPATTTIFSSGTYTSSGYTLVFNGSLSPVAGSWNTINLQTSFFRTAGSNLQVLIERLDGIQHLANVGFTNGFIAATSNGNNNSVSAFSSRRYNGSSVPGASTSLSITPFRPAIKLIYQNQIDLMVKSAVFPVSTCFSSPQTISVNIGNIGSGIMTAGSANIMYRSGGANSNNITTNINSSIGSGDSLLVNIPGVVMNNPGITLDTFIVRHVSDQNLLNDTLITSHRTAGNITQFPFEEHFENTSGEFDYFSNVTGERNLWTLQNGGYSNPDQTDILQPRNPGNGFLMFDAYGGANSNGFISRVYGSCISIPGTNTYFPVRNVKLSFWMSHDPTSAFVYDSLYVVVSENKGQTWQRIQGYQRWDENLDLPEWRKDSVDLSSYAGKTIQVGFEGVSKYGNVIGLDDIEFSVTPFCSNPPTAFAGQSLNICQESVYSLSSGNPTIGGSATNGYWQTSGSGSFSGTNSFGSALQYSPSSADKASGSVTLSLITNNPDTANCLADTSNLIITILPLSIQNESYQSCDSFTWKGVTYFQSGVYDWNGTNQYGCDSLVQLNLVINTSKISNDTIQTCTPYAWNGNTYTTSGLYYFTTTGSNGCDSVSMLKLEVVPCVTTLTIHALLEGYYRGTDSMSTPLYDLGLSTNANVTDSIEIILWRNEGNQQFNFSFSTVMLKNGMIYLELPDSLRGDSFYIGLKHRNHLETWSGQSVAISYNTIYSFKDQAEKALSDGVNPGMKYLGPNQFAIYSGDVNLDGTIDLFDLQQVENDAASFVFGYEYSDVNGDTASDLFDLQLIENNSTLFIFSTRPF